jgi:hypothetical protein
MVSFRIDFIFLFSFYLLLGYFIHMIRLKRLDCLTRVWWHFNFCVFFLIFFFNSILPHLNCWKLGIIIFFWFKLFFLIYFLIFDCFRSNCFFLNFFFLHVIVIIFLKKFSAFTFFFFYLMII